MEPEPRFLRGSDEIDKHGGKLPHWQQGTACVFVTFRLADSMPASVTARLEEFKEAWLRIRGGVWTGKLRQEWQREHAREIDHVLDAGHGSCLLRQPENWSIVAEVLTHGHGSRYSMHDAVVMPNHVHALFSPEAHQLEKEVQAWKSISSRRLNKKVGPRWPGWQKNYYDRLIRDREHFEAILKYIRKNPNDLRKGEYWLQSES